MQTTVVKTPGSKGDVYIGRPSKWGNPFKIGADGNREQVIQKFKDWVLSHPDAAWIRENVHTLKGKRLVCFCAPLACHGDVLAAMADGRI